MTTPQFQNPFTWMASTTAQLKQLIEMVSKVSSTDAEIQAATATLVADNQLLQNLITQVLAEVQAGGVSDATIAALQAAVSTDDSTVQGLNTTVNPPAPTPPSS
jgi:membrane-bound lytic murein transglycosylase B